MFLDNFYVRQSLKTRFRFENVKVFAICWTKIFNLHVFYFEELSSEMFWVVDIV